MKKKIIIPAFALLIGVGLAGSITGTAAWYQYSTKVNGAYVGASGGASGNLNMRIRQDGQGVNDGWTTFISKETMKSYLEGKGFAKNILPVTPGNLTKDSDLSLGADGNPVMYANPIAGRAAYENWKKASKQNYIVIPLQLRYVERDGVKENGVDEKNLAKEVFLSDLVLEQPNADASAHNDISEALRFHISAYDSSAASPTKLSRLISKKGGTTVTNGKLDLDGDGNPDVARASDKYGFDEVVDVATPINYGNGQQVSYIAEPASAPISGREYYNEQNVATADGDVYSMIPESREGKIGDDLDDDSLEYDTGASKSIGSTFEGDEKFLNVDITIWVEGWQKFKAIDDEDAYSSIWNKKYIDAAFNIGFEFAINAEADA